MNEENGKNNVTSYNNVKKNYAHLASEIKNKQMNILNFNGEMEDNETQNDDGQISDDVNQKESLINQKTEELKDNDFSEDEDIVNEKKIRKQKKYEGLKKFGKKTLFWIIWRKYKVPIIIANCGILLLMCLIFLVGFLPNAGGILELTNNNDNNKFESKETGSDGEVTIGSDNVPYLVNEGFTYFFQYNYAHVSYGYGTTIATSGCCPTAMAMILTNITGQMITPIETANYSLKNGYRVEGNGTAWAFMPAVSSAYGVTCTQINTDAASISNSLLSGKLISMSVNPGHFSSGGHFIVLRKVTEDGRIIVADPNSEERSKMAWDISIFPSEAAAAWACSK